jgi:hypothetical protein
MKIYFDGRTDGLGNRIIEIIFLEYVASMKNISINYLWNNHPRRLDRSYPVMIKSKNVNIINNLSKKGNFNDHFQFRELFSSMDQTDWVKYAKFIQPAFSIPSKKEKYTSIHLRGGDRILNLDKYFIKKYLAVEKNHYSITNFEFNRIKKKSLKYINKLKPENIFICTDIEDEKIVYLNKLNFKYNLKNLGFDEKIPAVYTDFFNLAFSREIIMVSKYSTFALMASLVGQTKLMVCDGIEINKNYSAYVERYN